MFSLFDFDTATCASKRLRISSDDDFVFFCSREWGKSEAEFKGYRRDEEIVFK